jgi:hypothetical protein
MLQVYILELLRMSMFWVISLKSMSISLRWLLQNRQTNLYETCKEISLRLLQLIVDTKCLIIADTNLRFPNW